MRGLFRGRRSTTSNTHRINQHHASDRPSNEQFTVSIKSVHGYNSRSDVDATDRQIVGAYTQMVTDRIEKGWTCHLVTLLFSQLPGTRAAVIGQMKDEIERVYSTFLMRVHRKPRTASPDELPVLIAVADLPIYKRDRSSSPLVLCNGGLHFHALLLVPQPRGEDEAPSAVSTCGVFKTVLRGRTSYDEALLVLPRASQELAD